MVDEGAVAERAVVDVPQAEEQPEFPQCDERPNDMDARKAFVLLLLSLLSISEECSVHGSYESSVSIYIQYNAIAPWSYGHDAPNPKSNVGGMIRLSSPISGIGNDYDFPKHHEFHSGKIRFTSAKSICPQFKRLIHQYAIGIELY